MGKYKLVALDMDGTILNEEQKISAENREAIIEANKAGVTVMFATGRGYQTAMPFVEEIGLQAPLITVNGGEVWRAPRERDLLHRETLAKEQVDKLRAIALRHNTWYWSFTIEGLFNKDRWVGDPNAVTFLKFGYSYENLEVLTQIRKEVESWGTLEVANSHPNNLEINPLGVNKAVALRRVCGMMGIDMSQVIAMGDSLNDIAMIREAGLGVAMGNAQEIVKQAADCVTLDNDNHGVAAAIRKYALGEG
jgi:HAD superfamily hydrolase (TIGR01484 family)